MIKRILKAFRDAANDPDQMRACMMPWGCISIMVIAIAAATLIPNAHRFLRHFHW